jgi:hypothetical protein
VPGTGIRHRVAAIAGLVVRIVAGAAVRRRVLVGAMMVGGLLARPWSAGAIAADSVSITLSQTTIPANGVSTTKVTVECASPHGQIEPCNQNPQGDGLGIATPGGQIQSNGLDLAGVLTATLTSTEIAGPWPIIGVDDTTGATATATLTQLPGPAAASPAGIYWADELSETLDGVSLDGSDPLSLDTQASLVRGLVAGAVGPVY